MVDIAHSEQPESNTSNVKTEFFETYGLRVLTSLRKIIRAVDIYSRKLNDEYKITVPQLICLYALLKTSPITQSQLSGKVNIGLSTMNGIIDRLEAKGYVLRQRDHKDRRKVFLELTETGRTFAQSAPSLLQDRLCESLQQLPELEQAAIALSLERVVQLMEVDHLEASPNLVPNSQMNDKSAKENA